MKPILFNTEMVKANLEGMKTATRRLIKAPVLYSVNEPPSRIFRDGDVFQFLWITGKTAGGFSIKPPYLPGDILYVRETWRVGAWSGPGCPLMAFDYADGTCGDLVHIEDREMFLRLVDQSREDARKAKCEYNGVDFVWKKGQAPTRWRPSIHMPKEAARIFLRVTNVRVERLQEITEEGAAAEGCSAGAQPVSGGPFGVEDDPGEWTAREHFAGIWNSTVAPEKRDTYGWAANPWVWVIEYKQITREEAHGN